MLIHRRLVQKPPVGPLFLDMDHPLAAGLTFALPLTDNGNAAPFDYHLKRQASNPGGVLWVPSPYGAASGGDGSTRYVRFADHLLLRPGASDFTVVVFGNPPSSNSTFGLYSKRNNTTFTQLSFLANVTLTGGANSPGNLGFYFSDGSNVSSATSTSSTAIDGNYHQFAWTRHGSGFNIYRDGVDMPWVAGSQQSPSYAGTDVVCIGALGGTSGAAGGYMPAGSNIVYAYYWLRVLTQQEILDVLSDPYQMFEGRTLQRFWAGTGVSAGVAQTAFGQTPAGTGSNQASATFGSPPAVGSIVRVFIGTNHFFGSADISGVADNQGVGNNTYTRDVVSTHPSGRVVATYSAKVNTSSGPFTVTVTTANGDDSTSIDIVEESGIVSAAWTDRSVTNSGAAGAWSTGNLSGTTSQKDEIEYVFIATDSTPNMSADLYPYTQIRINGSGNSSGSSGPANYGLWYRRLRGTLNTGASGGHSGVANWVALAVTDKANLVAGGGGTISKSGTDAGTPAGSETVAGLTNTAIQTDTGAMVGTDGHALAATLSQADASTATGTESGLPANILNQADASTATGTEATAPVDSLSLADTGATAGTEGRSLAATLSQADATTATGTTAAVPVDNLSLVDASTATGAEASSPLDSFSLADASTAASTEAVTAVNNAPGIDAGHPAGAESGGSSAALPAADAGPLISADAQAVAVTPNGTDAAPVGSSEGFSESATVTNADTTRTVGTESAALGGVFPTSGSDASAILDTDSATLQVATWGADASHAAGAELATPTAFLSVQDAAGLLAVETATVSSSIGAGDSSLMLDAAVAAILSVLADLDVTLVSGVEAASHLETQSLVVADAGVLVGDEGYELVQYAGKGYPDMHAGRFNTSGGNSPSSTSGGIGPSSTTGGPTKSSAELD